MRIFDGGAAQVDALQFHCRKELIHGAELAIQQPATDYTRLKLTLGNSESVMNYMGYAHIIET